MAGYAGAANISLPAELAFIKTNGRLLKNTSIC
jgi:hypothetical protein